MYELDDVTMIHVMYDDHESRKHTLVIFNDGSTACSCGSRYYATATKYPALKE